MIKNYSDIDPWILKESTYNPEHNEISESLFALGNGHMGQRANFVETYSGPTLQGTYLGGVYYPDKTRVGWWKIGYPEYFAKVLNSTNWIGFTITIGDEVVDMAKATVLDHSRTLDMKEGILCRSSLVRLESGKEIRIETKRFCSQKRKEIGAVQLAVTPKNFSADIHIEAFLDGTIQNNDSNYEEIFWAQVSEDANEDYSHVTIETLKTFFTSCTLMKVTHDFEENYESHFSTAKYAAVHLEVSAKEGQTYTVTKYISSTTSRDHKKDDLLVYSKNICGLAADAGFETLAEEHKEAWAEIWENADITIEGDAAAQQGIRFTIFHLQQTYSGHDSRLNIGPKGFTGEKYGGCTYWDTEAYCLPFYLFTSGQEIAKNLLFYRYNHLEKAIENAEKLGFSGGAALYPMVTMNGEESHNEWEITFEEIHRNGAIAYAIYYYELHTGDMKYAEEFGIEVLIAIARFWAQRVHWSNQNNCYMMHGVTGPNEYENNVNNNWYTNYIARWCLEYTIEIIERLHKNNPDHYQKIVEKVRLKTDEELNTWRDIIEKMYLPHDEDRNVFIQHDTFLDKVLMPASELPKDQVPLNQNWSWDRILRSCFIKQADVLQGIYFFYDNFSKEEVKNNFDFYEPMTVHESSLSPCVHSILACRLQYDEKAYEMYARSARLDLDNYNNDTEDGLHITSMAGAWLSVVVGFGGMKMEEGILSFSPQLPSQWKSIRFRILYRGNLLEITIESSKTMIKNLGTSSSEIKIDNSVTTIEPQKSISV